MGPWGSSHMASQSGSVERWKLEPTDFPLSPAHAQGLPTPKTLLPCPFKPLWKHFTDTGGACLQGDKSIQVDSDPHRLTSQGSYTWHLHPHPSPCSAEEKPVPVPSPSKQSWNKLALQGSVHQTPRNTDRTLRTKESSCKKYQLRQMMFTDGSIAVQLWSCWCPPPP